MRATELFQKKSPFICNGHKLNKIDYTFNPLLYITETKVKYISNILFVIEFDPIFLPIVTCRVGMSLQLVGWLGGQYLNVSQAHHEIETLPLQ